MKPHNNSFLKRIYYLYHDHDAGDDGDVDDTNIVFDQNPIYLEIDWILVKHNICVINIPVITSITIIMIIIYVI